MRKGKLVTIFLVVVMVFTTVAFCFAACNNDEDKKEVVLRILENDTAKKEGYLKELLDAFNAKYASEGVKAVDANMDEFSDLEKDGPYGHGPDVLYQANDILMSYVEKHHIIPLDIEQMDCYDKIPQNAWNAFKHNYDGKTVYCGVPVNVQQPLLFYRKDALPDNWKTEWDKNGNDVPDMVEYWTEMYRYSKGIRQADINKFGYAIELRNEYFNIGFLLSYGAYVFGNNNTDDKDIGIAKGNAVKGAKIMWELAGVMDEKCIDDSFTNGRAPMLANGTIFATITTPDITSQFLKEMSLQYQKEGLDQASADAKAKENLVITGLPKLPKNGDITTQQDIKNGDLWIEQQTMGGVNGYAVSSYTKNRDWAVKFVEFATGYEMVKARADMLGVVAARSDVIAQTESLASQITYRNLDSGVLEVMPSISAVKQIWTPISSGFKQIATDGCGKRSFDTAKLQSVIEEISSNIYKAIHTFA